MRKHSFFPITTLGAMARSLHDDINISREPQVLYKAADNAENWHDGHPELFDGIQLCPGGAVRIMLHEPSNTHFSVFAKNPHWLRGEYDDKGIIRPIYNPATRRRSLQGIYGIAAYRSMSRAHVTTGAFQSSDTVRGVEWHRDLRSFHDKIRDSSQMHLTMYGADVTEQARQAGGILDGGFYNMFANASQGYAIIKPQEGAPARLVHYPVSSHAHGHGFISMGYEDKLYKRVASMGHSIGSFDDPQALGRALLDHWKKKASDKWYGLDTMSFREAIRAPLMITKRSLYDGVEWVKEEGWKAFAASAGLAMLMGPFSVAAAIGAIEHRALDELLVKYYDKAARRRLKRLNALEDYPDEPGDNTLDHFLERTAANLRRVCPEFNEYFAPDMRFLNAHDSRLCADGGYVYEGFRPEWKFEYMLTVPSKGFNGFGAIPDRNSILKQYFNGFTGLYHFDPSSEKLTAYVKYRKQLDIEDNLKLPRIVREDIDDPGRVLKLEYRRNQPMKIGDVTDGSLQIAHQYVSLEVMMREMEGIYSKSIRSAPNAARSLDYLRRTFDDAPDPSLIVLPFPALGAAAPL